MKTFIKNHRLLASTLINILLLTLLYLIPTELREGIMLYSMFGLFIGFFTAVCLDCYLKGNEK